MYAVKSGRLSLFMVLYNLKNMEILVEVPQEILDGIARGEYIRRGGVVVTKEGHKVIAWLKETVATGSNIPVCLPKISVHHN